MTRKTSDDAGALEDKPGLPAGLPFEALDDRIAIVGTSGSGKTYTAKGLVERLLTVGARVAIIDPLGVARERRRYGTRLSGDCGPWYDCRSHRSGPNRSCAHFVRSNIQHPTYKAFSELGRAVKTIFLCKYLHSEALRREVNEV